MSGENQDLRTRIAKALWDFACPEVLKKDNPEPGKAFLQMADAVIRELRLTRQVSRDTLMGDTHDYHRYVTEWTADD